MYKHILALDPSGNFHEGKGTTGWVLMNYKEKLIARGYISAKNYSCPEEYWDAHINLIEQNHKKYGDTLIVVMEDYVLYRDKATNQTNSKIETCRLLGVLQHTCWKLKQPYSMQLAASVKQRWSDDLLFREHIIFRDKRNIIHTDSGMSLGLVHTRDAFRHAMHYIVCRNNDSKPTYKPHTKGAYNNVRSNY